MSNLFICGSTEVFPFTLSCLYRKKRDIQFNAKRQRVLTYQFALSEYLGKIDFIHKFHPVAYLPSLVRATTSEMDAVNWMAIQRVNVFTRSYLGKTRIVIKSSLNRAIWQTRYLKSYTSMNWISLYTVIVDLTFLCSMQAPSTPTMLVGVNRAVPARIFEDVLY